MDTSGPVTAGSPPPIGAAGTPHRRVDWVRAAPLAVWAGLASASGYVLANNPADRSPDPLGGCGWNAAFGTNGPTCGGTRMVWYLLHGDLVNAARSHLVALAGVPFLLYALVQWTAASLFRWRLPVLRLPSWFWIAYGVLFVLYGAVLRNLPGFEWFHLDFMQPGIGL